MRGFRRNHTGKGASPRLPAELTPRSNARLHTQGHLVVYVDSVKKVPGGAVCDSHISVTVKGVKQQTRTITKTATPVWQERVQFGGELREFVKAVVGLELWTDNGRGGDHKVGSANINLQGVLDTLDSEDFELSLGHNSVLKVGIRWEPKGLQTPSPNLVQGRSRTATFAEAPRPAPMQTPAVGPKQPAQPAPQPELQLAPNTKFPKQLQPYGMVVLQLHRASGLVGNTLGRALDPYVVFTFGGHIIKSRSIKKSCVACLLAQGAGACCSVHVTSPLSIHVLFTLTCAPSPFRARSRSTTCHLAPSRAPPNSLRIEPPHTPTHFALSPSRPTARRQNWNEQLIIADKVQLGDAVHGQLKVAVYDDGHRNRDPARDTLIGEMMVDADLRKLEARPHIDVSSGLKGEPFRTDQDP